MTSTVLDVTVMLLCISASVVALGGAADDPFGDRGAPDAERVADRLTTETATVSYDVGSASSTRSDGRVTDERPATPDEADADQSTVHATLAELLVLAGGDADGTSVQADTRGSTEIAADDTPMARFTPRVVATVSEAFGPRTRIDARPDTVPSIGSEPPRGADVTTAVVGVPAPGAAGIDADRVRFVIRVW